ncbi:hypothetical protein LCGC14_0974850 [marine sediment metagenome]|uniref:Uncharacterized protein n=1 Tax=marine sediment metagenome TaxID=412755 RepID=A0A0F9NEZ2_9ZZZZ
MQWMTKMKEFGGADVGYLSEDGEMTTFVVVGDPQLIVGLYKKQETKRIGVPCVTIEGFQLLVIGMRVGRRLSKYEKHLHEWAFELVRHGGTDDSKTTYEMGRTEDKELEKKLLAAAEGQDFEEEIKEAVEAATEIGN